jgi:GT2 family glycosyltransferase
VTTGPGLTLWIAGAGHPESAVASSLREAIRQASEPLGSVVEIVCVVGQESAAQIGRIAESSPVAARVLTATPDGTDDSAGLNEVLAGLRSDWLVWIEASSVLANGALAQIGLVVARFPLDLFYGDTELSGDTVLSSTPDRAGTRVRRPDPSPLRLRSQDYLGDVRGFRIERIRELGGFRTGAGGAHAFDLSLRLGLDPVRTAHIPAALALSRDVRREMTAAHRSAVAHRLAADGVSAEIEPQDATSLRLRYPVEGAPLVSIVIPTRGSRARIRGTDRVLVVDAVRGILERSTYPSLEFVIVADDETPQPVIDELRAIAGDRLRLVRWSDAFNFSAKMNRGAVFARGDYLLLLNDDVELVTADWIETMLGLVRQPGVGLVGTLLHFEDGSVQHGGHLYSSSWAGHIAFGWAADRDDQLGSMRVDREVSGVTAACAMISADTFWEIGGFSPDYAGNYNDVDFSLKVRSTGRSVVWTPHAQLFHFESKSRVATVVPAELATLRRHWGTRLLSDPYWR